MSFRMKLGGLHAAGAILIVSTLFTGCTRMVTEEQLAQIRDLRAQDRQLATDIGRAEADRARIDTEIRSRQTEARRCEEDRAFVQQKLATWPNIWPDYTEPPPPAPEPEKPRRRR